MPKVAILGGGIASLAAAWKLSADPSYDITVYQRDHLLGGKGASTHDAAQADRIHEHGIHLLMGFYDGALSMLEEAYAEAHTAGANVMPWDEALMPWDEVTFAEPGPPWSFWKVPFPTNSEPLGGGGAEPDLAAMIANAFGWFLTFLARIDPQLPSSPFIANFRILFGWIFRLALWLLQLGVPVGWLFDGVRWFIDRILTAVWPGVAPLAGANASLRRLWVGLWLAGTNLRGMIVDDLLHPPFDFAAVDGLDYRAWLQNRNVVPTAPSEVSWDSAPVKGLYDLAFASSHSMAAGTVIYNALHIALAYKGHLAYRMRAGMGETVFTPLYHALAARGVKFAFFHEVTNVSAATVGGKLVVDRIDLRKTDVAGFNALAPSYVELSNGSQVAVDSWPREPGGAFAAPQSLPLQRGTDFDLVVLGISVGALPGICGPLAAQDLPFGQMIQGLTTLPTQSAQLWLDDDLATLGWPHSSAAVISFTRPFNSWLDMTHVLKAEAHGPGGPRSLAYFSDELPAASLGFVPPPDLVWTNLVSFALNDLPALWPGFTLDRLHDPGGGVGFARLQAQYWRANTDLSDRYVIPVPGSNSLRLASDGTAFHNLALAGDWVRTRLNTGCIECATQGGFAAAEAILGGSVHP